MLNFKVTTQNKKHFQILFPFRLLHKIEQRKLFICQDVSSVPEKGGL